LSAKKDALGMSRVSIKWRLGSNVQRTFDRTFSLLAEDMRQSGIADVTLDPAIEGGDWPSTLVKEGTWHHMGTTRMHDSPKQGVVDRNCKVHGISNLYVGGSSVFPTAGANFPTITLTALALRLSDQVIEKLKAPDLVVPGERSEQLLTPRSTIVPAADELALASTSFKAHSSFP
jgi:choline dehydrogenase-like flavoprotein